MILRARTFRVRKDDRGFMAAEWMMGISLLLIPAFVIVYSIVQVPARKNLTQVASAAAARAYVQALDQSQADAAASAAAAEAIASETGESVTDVDAFLAERKAEVKITAKDGYCPGAEITAVVKLPLPVALNPFDSYRKVNSSLKLGSAATERIDDYAELADSTTGKSNVSSDYDIENGTCPE